MGMTVARWLRRHDDPAAMRSLDLYERFVLREFFDEKTCVVYDTIGKDPTYKRLYNAPNLVQLWRELYMLKKYPRYLDYIEEEALLDYYRIGGEQFYPNGCDGSTEITLLEKRPDVGNPSCGRRSSDTSPISSPTVSIFLSMRCASSRRSRLRQWRFLHSTTAFWRSPPKCAGALKRTSTSFRASRATSPTTSSTKRQFDIGMATGRKRHLYGDTLHQHSTITARAFLSTPPPPATCVP